MALVSKEFPTVSLDITPHPPPNTTHPTLISQPHTHLDPPHPRAQL